jgi:hypothetical protein
MRRSKKLKPTFDVARTELSVDRVGWVYRSETLDAGLTQSPVSAAPNPPVSAEPAQTESRSWIETGVSVMVLPFSLTLVAVVAPMFWLLSSRDNQ